MPTRTWALIGTLLLAGMPAAAEVAFDRSELVTGYGERQTVLAGFLLDSAVADLAVLKIDADGDRRLQIHGFDDGRWTSQVDTTLRREVSFVDIAEIDGRERLVAYGGGRLSWFDPESATERAVVDVRSNFKPPRKDEIPHVDVTRDVNGDGREELVVPVADGFRIFVQQADGGFFESITVGRPPDLSRILGAGGYRYDPWSESRVHEIDYNRDGRRDLVYWNEDRFVVHTQDERGLFTEETRTFKTEVPFDSDRIDFLATGEMTGRVLHSLADLNGDGIGDLVVLSLEGRSIRRKRSKFEVHFGKPTQGGTAFARETDLTFRADDRILVGMDRHDFDGDGRVDLMLTSIEIRFLEYSLWKKLKGFMGDDVKLVLEFYRNEGGSYRETPNTVRGIGLDGTPSHREPGWVSLDLVLRGGQHERRKTDKYYPRAFNPTLLIGDVTGDGRSDLIFEHTFRGLGIFVGVPGPELFAAQAHALKVIVPADEEYNRLVDLNRDGKLDILLHDPFTERTVHGGRIRPPGTEPHRVRVLIAEVDDAG